MDNFCLVFIRFCLILSADRGKLSSLESFIFLLIPPSISGDSTRQRRPKSAVSLYILVAARLRVCWVPDIFQEAPDLLQIVAGVVLQPSAVSSGLAAVRRNVTKKNKVRHLRPLREMEGSAPGAPAGVLVKSLNTFRPTPPGL